MIKFALLFLVLSTGARAYVPTVESLFRHGGNAEVTANTVSMSLKVTRPMTGEEAQPTEDFYKLFITRSGTDAMKIAQTRYTNASYSESSLDHKTYFPNFTAFTMKPSADQVEKGLFFALVRSLVLNDGEHMVQYLKTLGVPVRLNKELINRDKIELLANYKRYLIATNRDRKKVDANPLRPEDPSERARVEKLMDESLYVDTKNVKLSRENGEMAWLITAGAFEAVVSYDRRHPLRLKYKTGTGEFEILCQDYWLSNGTHYMPRLLTVKNISGETYQVEIGSFRHLTEKEDDTVRRLQKWDQILKGKESAGTPRPEFLL